MREIKFRAWDKDNKMMMPNIQNQYAVGINIELRCFRDAIEHPSLEVMQYTGLKDKNGVEIYEGDIVEISFMEGGKKLMRVRSEIKWHNGYGNVFDNPTYYTPEVIGNIHENPEMVRNEINEG